MGFFKRLPEFYLNEAQRIIFLSRGLYEYQGFGNIVKNKREIKIYETQ